MARARKTAETPEPTSEQSDQERREAAREAAGVANQDQMNAPVHEQQPQPDTRHFIAQPDVLNAPEGESAEGSSDGSAGDSSDE